MGDVCARYLGGSPLNAAQLWRLSRPPTLAATVVPVAVGVAAGALVGSVSWTMAVLMLLVGMLIQAATNVANEYYDFARGIDHSGSKGIAGFLVSGAMKPADVKRLAFMMYGLALVLGLVLVAVRGPVMLLLGLLSIVVSYLYSAGPHPISGTPFGEIVVLVFMGPLEVAVSEYAAVAQVSRMALLASVTVGLMVAAILFANNLRDLDSDQQRGRLTLAIVLGDARARWVLSAILAAAVLWPLLAVAYGLFPRTVVVVLVAAPLVLGAARALLRGRMQMAKLVPEAAKLHLAVGLLLSIGLGLSRLTVR